MSDIGQPFYPKPYNPGQSMVNGVTPAVQVPASANIPSSGSQSAFNGAFANPNGNVTPTDATKAAIYIQDSVPLNQWVWDVPSQTWLQTMQP